MSMTTAWCRYASAPSAIKTRSPQGFSLFEVMVAVIILSLGMLVLAGAGTFGLKQTTRAKKDLRYSADLEQVADSLINLGFGKVASGSATVRGRSLSWTVSDQGANSQLVTLVVVRTNNGESQLAAGDTVSLYLAK
jgi:prepilin-type N-terminal cleavage/methylation domain-containing protein